MNNVNYFHIGFFKTGTTFLQKNVFPDLSHLFYVGGYDLMYNYNFNKLLYNDSQYFDIQLIEKEFSKIEKPVLLSSEWLIGDLKFSGMNRSIIAERLHQLSPNAEIILFIRSQPELMQSFYNQLVKVKRTHLRLTDFYPFLPDDGLNISMEDINQKLKKVIKKHYYHPLQQEFYPNFFNFYDIITLYKKKFNNVHVFLYEDFLYNPDETLNKLLKVLGSSLNEKDFKKNIGLKENISLSKNNQESQRIFNKLSLVSGNKLYRKTINVLSKKIAKDTSQIDTDYLRNYCELYFKESNNKLNNEFPDIGINKYPNNYFIDQ